MKKLAEFAYTKRRLVVPVWLLLLVAFFGLSMAFGGEFRTEFKLPGSESQAAIDLLKEKGVDSRTGFAGQVVFRADQGVNTPAVRGQMENFFKKIESGVEGVQVASPYDPQNSYQISRDAKIAYAELRFSDRDNEQYTDDAKTIKDLWKATDFSGTQVELGGDLFADQPDFSSEGIGIIAAVIILLIAFGSVLAMGLPILTALFGIGCGSALIGLLAAIMSVPDFTTQVAAMIGIGVGIDYALLIVTRYRAALHDGLTPHEAAVLALDTSGRAVVFAGITVVISLLGMYFLNLDFMRAMASGAVLAVLMTMLAAITLLPAMLGFVGGNVDSLTLRDLGRFFWNTITLRPIRDVIAGTKTVGQILGRLVAFFKDIILLIPRLVLRAVRQAPAPATSSIKLTDAESGQNSIWYRWSRVIQGHPWPALIVSTAILLVLAFPVFSLRLGFADAGNRGTSDTTRRAYDLLSDGFGPGFNGPILVVVETKDNGATTQLKTTIQSVPGVASVTDPTPLANGELQLITVFATTSPQDEKTTDLVHRLRQEISAQVVSNRSFNSAPTTGGPAFVVDFSDYMGNKLPIFFGAVLVLSFLLLLAVFHSVVVPLKAVIMNMLSIGASFGAMVAVFQWGVGASIIGVSEKGPIEAWAPMMLFAIVFGLSMDYEVFLLTRVREEYDRNGNDNGRAVADGLAATGRVISAAALIMVCVFGSFILGAERSLKLLGFGLAFAIFIDATIVRLVLVPSAMELLGDKNWWAPSWLVRLLPTIRVDTVERPAVPEPGTGAGSGG